MPDTITIRCTWESVHEVEVPAGYTADSLADQVNTDFDSIPDEIMGELTSETAGLIDWSAS